MATKTKLSREMPPPMPEPTPEERAAMTQASADDWSEMFDAELGKALADMEEVSELARSLNWKITSLASTMQSVGSYTEYILHGHARGARINSAYANEPRGDDSEPFDDAQAQLRAFAGMLTMMKKASGHYGKLEAARSALNSLDRYF